MLFVIPDVEGLLRLSELCRLQTKEYGILKPPPLLHILDVSLNHLINLISSLKETPRPEMGLSDEDWPTLRPC